MFTSDIDKTEQDKLTSLLEKIGSKNQAESIAAQEAFAISINGPLRAGITSGDIISNIYVPTDFKAGAEIAFPIDFYRTDNADEFVAYVIPNQGAIPSRQVQGDQIRVPTYDIGNSIDFLLRYAQEARWDVVSRAIEVLEAGVVKKKNDDGWHTLLSAAVDRNVVVQDSAASAGQFTKRLVSLMKIVMRRNAGGNSTSQNRGKLTHLFTSPEAIEDMRNWDLTLIDDVTRREIWLADDGSYNKVFGVTLVDLDELGEGQEYNNYFDVDLGGSFSGGDLEVVVGLDLSDKDSFKMPIREAWETHVDPTFHRQRRASFYGWMGLGFLVLNGSRVLLGSL